MHDCGEPGYARHNRHPRPMAQNRDQQTEDLRDAHQKHRRVISAERTLDLGLSD